MATKNFTHRLSQQSLLQYNPTTRAWFGAAYNAIVRTELLGLIRNHLTVLLQLKLRSVEIRNLEGTQKDCIYPNLDAIVGPELFEGIMISGYTYTDDD